MSAAIATLIAAAVGGVGAFFTWKSSKLKQRREAEKDVAAEHAAAEARRAEIEAAVHGNDEAKVNEIVAGLLG